ncbi:MAG TPA: CopG family transcriptional regulator [Ideonella sp.]|nr:CopG family transcriptional regulator [Ideonella sp.]
MRTTLDLDSDVLQSAKELARRQGKTAGQVISDLVRRALSQPADPTASATLGVQEPAAFYGFQPFPSRGQVVTNDAVNRLRDDGEY